MTVSRRDFLKSCAIASSVPVLGLSGPALAAEAPRRRAAPCASASTSRRPRWTRTSRAARSTGRSTTTSTSRWSCWTPSSGIKPGLAESWQQPDPQDAGLQAAPRRQVPRRHRLQRRGRQVQLRPHEDRSRSRSARARSPTSTRSTSSTRYTIKTQPEAAGRGAAGHPDRPRRHDGLAQGRSRSAAPELERNAKGAGTGPFEFVEWVKDDHLLLKRNDELLEQGGRPVPRPSPLPADPRRHRQAAEPPGRRDRRDGLRPAARRGRRSRRDKNVVVVDVPSLADFAYQLNHTRPPFDNKALRQAVAVRARPRGDRQGRLAERRACRPTGRSRRRAGPTTARIPPIKRDLAQGQGQAGRGRQAERLHVHHRRPTTSRSTSRKPR